LVVMGCTSRQSWTEGLLPVGLGLGLALGDGLLDPEPVGLGEAEAEPEGLVLGLAEALLEALGVAVALLVALGVLVAFGVDVAFGVLLGVALAVAFAVAVAFALAVAVALALAVAEALALAVALAAWAFLALCDLDFGVLDDTASRMSAVRPADPERAAEVVAGGWPHTSGAAALTLLTSDAAFTVLASAVLTPRRPMLEETMAAPATMPNAEAPDRADFMAAPSSPWSSSSRPRVSSG
jgi:hypothetical protein